MKKTTLKATKKTEIVTVRFDPRLRFAITIAARAQRRSIAGWLEWAAAEMVKQTTVASPDETAHDLADACWDTTEEGRIRNMAECCPNLLTFEEEVQHKQSREIQKQEPPPC